MPGICRYVASAWMLDLGMLDLVAPRLGVFRELLADGLVGSIRTHLIGLVLGDDRAGPWCD